MTIEEWRGAAEQALSAAWGAPVSCTLAEVLRDRGRNRVYRLAVDGGPTASVILKACVSNSDGNPYAEGDPAPDSAFSSLCNEWAGARLLGPLGLGPNVYGGDRDRGFCLLEDLNDGETLADKLTATDPAAATSALLAYARSLGDLHAATSRNAERWDTLLADLGCRAGGRGPLATNWRHAAEHARTILSEMGVTAPARLDVDLARIGEALDRPGGYLAFTPSDCCPDNHFLRGERVVFFDCEGAAMRHALLDAAYFLAPFPTCWCAAAMPPLLPEHLLIAYRERFPGGPDFQDQLTLMLAAWLAHGLAAWRLEGVSFTRADAPWGLSTIRQRVLALISHLLARPNFEELLPGLAEVVRRLSLTWRADWADLAPMPLYPAFC